MEIYEKYDLPKNVIERESEYGWMDRFRFYVHGWVALKFRIDTFHKKMKN